MHFFKYLSVLLFLVICRVGLSQEMSMHFSLRTDSTKEESTIYLWLNNDIEDSLVLEDRDFIKDSLYSINDTLWSYIYSIGFDISHDMVTIRQILLEEWDGQIHVPYVGVYEKYFETPNTDSYTHDMFSHYELDLFSNKGIKVEMKYFQLRVLENELSRDSTTNVVFLDYDYDKRIYYSSKKLLNGEYKFYPKEPYKRKPLTDLSLRVNFKDEEVFSLNLGGKHAHSIYLENRWYIFEEFPYHTNVISYFPVVKE